MDGGMQPTANADAGAQPEATGLALLRRPFPPNQISKLPKPTKKQTDEVRDDFKKGIRCQICGAWHHKDVLREENDPNGQPWTVESIATHDITAGWPA